MELFLASFMALLDVTSGVCLMTILAALALTYVGMRFVANKHQ